MKKTTEFLPGIDRYLFDFQRCASNNGWAQADTTQDASYYGNWINPLARKIVSYAEGDVTVEEYDSDEEFTEAVNKFVDWHKKGGYWKGIDDMCREDIRARLEELNLAHHRHPDPEPAAGTGAEPVAPELSP